MFEWVCRWTRSCLRWQSLLPCERTAPCPGVLAPRVCQAEGRGEHVGERLSHVPVWIPRRPTHENPTLKGQPVCLSDEVPIIALGGGSALHHLAPNPRPSCFPLQEATNPHQTVVPRL